jgi:hypothetical protein
VRTDRVNLGRLEYTSPQVGFSFLKTEIAGAPVPEILVEFLTTPTLCQIRCLLGLGFADSALPWLTCRSCSRDLDM